MIVFFVFVLLYIKIFCCMEECQVGNWNVYFSNPVMVSKSSGEFSAFNITAEELFFFTTLVQSFHIFLSVLASSFINLKLRSKRIDDPKKIFQTMESMISFLVCPPPPKTMWVNFNRVNVCQLSIGNSFK